MDTIRDITIGWENGEKIAEINTPNCRIKNKVVKLHEKFPDEFGCYIENLDGSLYAKIPVKWIRINRPSGHHHEFTEEEKAANAERLRKYREEKQARMSGT